MSDLLEKLRRAGTEAMSRRIRICARPELAFRRGFAGLAVGVVGGNAILGAEEGDGRFGTDYPRGISVGDAFIADDWVFEIFGA